MVNGSLTPAPIVAGDSFWAAVGNDPGNPLDFVGLAAASQPDNGFYVQKIYVNGSGNVDLIVPTTEEDQFGNFVPVPSGSYEARLIINDGAVVARVPFVVSAYVEPPFPGINTVVGISVFYPRVTGGTTPVSTPAVVVVKGTITLGGFWENDDGGSFPENVTVQYLLNDQPIGSPVTTVGNAAPSLTFDTTTKPDGTYVLGAKMVDCNDVSHPLLGGKWNAYQLVPLPQNFIIANHGLLAATAHQTIPTFYGFENNHAAPATVDYLNYQGIPQPAAPYPYPGPGQTVVTAAPSSAPSLRNANNWYFECLTETRYFEYESASQFWQTKLGGVFAGGWSAKNAGSGTLEGSYPEVVRTSFRDGGRNSNMISPFISFVATPAGAPFSAHWTGAQIDGRICTIDLTGTVTTIAGPTRDLTQLPFDWTDSTTPEFTNDKIVGTIASGAATFGDFGGINDLCWDPRNPNVLYATKALDHCIIKVDLTNNPPYGPTNPLCSLYAGQDGVAGHADGAALSALFNGPYSICMQKVAGIPGHPVGTMYIADNYNCLIRMISADGTTVSTLAGQANGRTNGAIPPPDAVQNGPNSAFNSTVQQSTTYGVTSITQNADGTTAAVVMASPTPIAGVGWKVTIEVNGAAYGDSDPSGGLEHTYGIYTVSAFADSQHFSVVMNPVPAAGSTLTAVVWSMETYSSPTPIAFASAYTAYPQTVRLSSTGDIVLGEAYYNQMLRRLWLSGTNAGKITRIGPFGNLAQAASTNWGWHDVDDVGSCGPVDDIVMFKMDANPGTANVMWRWSIDGSYSEIGGGGAPGDVAAYIDGQGGGGHYPWAFAFSKTQARILSMGLSDTGVYSWRARQSGDPLLTYDATLLTSGYEHWIKGTVGPFPFGLRPAFAALYGQAGTHHFGNNVLPTLDDLQSLYPTDSAFAAFIQGGAGGSFPRPEYSIDDKQSPAVFGRDLRDLLYWMRRNTLAGSYPTEAVPGPTNLDFIRPVVSNVSATRLGNTSIRVSWTTDKPTIGLAAAGSPYSQSSSWAGPYPYNIWSPLETGYGTSHTVTITGLPDVSVSGNGPSHYTVVSKDKAGNWATASDATIA